MTPIVYVCVEYIYRYKQDTAHDDDVIDSVNISKVFYYETDAIKYCKKNGCSYYKVMVRDKYES